MIELSAVFNREKFRFANSDGDVIVGEAQLVNGSASLFGDEQTITIKGKADEGDLETGVTYRFYGKTSNYKNRRTGKTEKQFAFNSFVESQPHGREGIIGYLIKAGRGNGIGKATATKIYQRFAEDAVRLLREEPETVCDAIGRLKLDQCVAASEWLEARVELENCTIELNNLLNGRGFPKSTVSHAIKIWGNRAVEIIKKRPYVLMGFAGCGFKRCDALYLDLGLNPARLLRQALCVWYSLSSSNDGHTWFPVNYAIRALKNQISAADIREVAALKMAKRIGLLSLDAKGAIQVLREDGGAVVSEGGKIWVGEGRKASNEDQLSQRIAKAVLQESHWPSIEAVENIDEHQRDELRKAISGGPIAILGGGPGTGKTFTGANLIKEMAKTVGYDNIAVAAPTGKAAVRISEVMEVYGIPLTARTWHSLLGVGFDDAGFSFAYNSGNPWEYKLIIGDETSMNDTDIMNSIFAARSNGTHFLFLGDVNQLPPVGHGAPLRDMIEAGVPYGELTEIKRNSGGIVETCQAIREGEKLPEDPGGNLIWLKHKEGFQADMVIDTCMAAREAGFDPIWDVQTLVAVNEKSAVSRKVMNEDLQGVLNPASSDDQQKQKFRAGDKVVNLKNGYFKLAGLDDDPEDETYVANGELAKVVEVHEKFFVAEVTSPVRRVRVPMGANWDLGYALSVHKSQGSEWPVVIVVVDEYPGAKMVCSREWLYTAVSRAKTKCFLIGKRSVAESMCRRTAIDKRKTFLRERIELAKAERQMVAL